MTNGQVQPPPAPAPPPAYAPPPVQQYPEVSGGMKILLYIICLVLGIPIGTIIGVIFFVSDNPHKKQVGKMCIILSIVGLLIAVICWFVVLAALIGTTFVPF